MIEKSATFGDGVSITEAIISAACELQDAEPRDLDFVLYDWVNPDALNELVTNLPNERCSATVEFSLADYQVTISTNRTLTVKKAAIGSTPKNPEQEVLLGE